VDSPEAALGTGLANWTEKWNVFLLCRFAVIAYGVGEPPFSGVSLILTRQARPCRAWWVVRSVRRTGADMSSLNSLTYDDLGSAAQRERRKRILDAAIALASKGGFEQMQMRAVAERADVALGTLYRYFPSKIHLLVPNLTEALTRAFMFADASVANEIHVVGMHVTRMLMAAMRDPQEVLSAGELAEPTEEEIAIAKVIGDVWLASLVQWVTGRASANDVAKSMDVAVHLLLR
jgi:AcrR family transcriptional regulator